MYSTCRKIGLGDMDYVETKDASEFNVPAGCCLLLFFPAGVNILILPDWDLQVTSNVEMHSLRSNSITTSALGISCAARWM